ncbi:MAG TPA: hypothetical protein PK106_01100 [Bacteroidales bacterium]|jgi:hypothetical protein|nr:hypothetical protein [Bacteroidales bacterium]
MDLNAAIDIIIKDLTEAQEIIDDLKKYSEVPVFQIELAKSKCKSASDVIALFKTLRADADYRKEEKSERTPFQTVDDKSPEPVKHEKPEVHTEEPHSFRKTEPAVTVQPQFVEENVSNPAPPVPVPPPPETEQKKANEAVTIADRFTDRPESFNEKLGSLKHDGDLLEVLKSKPLSSLNQAIGINDKFLFIREIFDGNHESYNQAITRLESVSSLEDARSVIVSFSGHDTENEAVKQLLDLIKRKLPANE